MRRWQNILFWVVLLWNALIVWYVATAAWHIDDGCIRALHLVHVGIVLATVAVIRFYGYRPPEWRHSRWPLHVVSILLGVAVVWAMYLTGILVINRYVFGADGLFEELTEGLPRLATDFGDFAGTYPTLTLRTAGLAAVCVAPLVALGAVAWFLWFRRRAKTPARQFLRWAFLLVVHVGLMTWLFYGGFETVRTGGSCLNYLAIRQELRSFPVARLIERADATKGWLEIVNGADPSLPTLPYGEAVQPGT